MSVQQTDRWLTEYVKQKSRRRNLYDLHRKFLCERITCCFHDAHPEEIQNHLIQHGMFSPAENIDKNLQKLIEKKCWRIIQDEYYQLQTKWNGPDVQIYIYPSAQNVRLLRKFFKGKSGLAYPDGLFLFVSPTNSEAEWRALLTHEYHHVYYMNKKGHELTLRDVILMEGMAEYAVRERHGEDYLAPWTSLYKKEDAQRIWKQYLEKFQELAPDHPSFRKLLYGGEGVPRWAGYFVGYHLVSSYVSNKKMSADKLIEIPAERFLQNKEWV
ncbi:DUF2268 domain-containing putative Zn-dependent protease [Bacillus tianshenii]|nr:DUF2268 domain-containing putative Zn-dependent protease [Bacillus tianshenii]